MTGILAAALIAAFLTAWITPIVLRYAEKSSAIDLPGERRINTRPMPRLGGIAIFIGFAIAVLLTVTLRQFSRTGSILGRCRSSACCSPRPLWPSSD